MTPFFQYTPNMSADHPVVNSLTKRLANLSPEARQAAENFSVLMPHAFASRFAWDVEGPIQKEFLPTAEELFSATGYSVDPLAESQAEVAPGLIGKYQGRVLLKVTTRCAIHCRFCFRRHLLTQSVPKKNKEWLPALQWIAQDQSVREVIFSGGDPLMVSDRRLSWLAHRLAAIPHLMRLRIHTRMPVVAPERITSGLIAWLRETRLTPIVVVHVNHVDELDHTAMMALARLVDGGIPVLSQSVLLKGVNDDEQTLVALFERLITARVIPYYLHMLDQVVGAAHFEVDAGVAIGIINRLRLLLPGYAVPRLVRETPGAESKLAL